MGQKIHPTGFRLAVNRNAWRRLALGSAASLTLWFVLLFVGTLLTASA